jgi:hypothetical protein
MRLSGFDLLPLPFLLASAKAFHMTVPSMQGHD